MPWLSVTPVAARQFGLFTYVVSEGVVSITDYPVDKAGVVDIPASIDGMPVTTISLPSRPAGASARASIDILALYRP